MALSIDTTSSWLAPGASIQKHSQDTIFEPSITSGLLFNAPLLTDAIAFTPAGRALETETVDADGTFEEAGNKLIRPAILNRARFEEFGLLIEETSTNNVPYSEDFSQWTNTNITIESDSVSLPDGTNGTVNTLKATSSNGTSIIDCGIFTGEQFMVWLRRKTGTGTIDITMNNGSSWTTVAITNQWVRYRLAASVANPDVGIRIQTSGDEIYSWGGQCDSLTRNNSYTPTTGGAAVTRSADIFKYDNSSEDIFDKAKGTIICAVRYRGSASVNGSTIFRNRPGQPNDTGLQANADGTLLFFINRGGVAQIRINSTTALIGDQNYIVAAVWDTNDFRLYIDDTLEGSDTAGQGSSLAADLFIGSSSLGTGLMNGWQRHFMVYSDAKDVADLTIMHDQIKGWL